MDRQCSACKQGILKAGVIDERLTVAGREFEAQLDAMTCPVCGESWVEFVDLQRFERAVALDLAREGEPSGEAFAFIRDQCNLTRDALAEMFQTTFEEVKAWETGAKPVAFALWVMLCRMVEEQSQGNTATRDLLTSRGSKGRALATQPRRFGHLAAQPAL